jgi:phosphoribosylamine--glycine ligase/phosphoribosylaminoimidazole synthetase
MTTATTPVTTHRLTVLVVGSGGREEALAWSAARSPHVRAVHRTGHTDPERVVAEARSLGVGLVLVGPEAALAAGVVDACDRAGIAAFGPTAAAARLESSKAFTRDFCARHGIASPAWHVASDPAEAVEWARSFGRPIVVKQSGLAAGKGVIVPDTWDETVAAIHTLAADGSALVLEERLDGEEVSLLAFCDGTTVVAMPPAQDHKRIGEGDRGPNTGGMGAYAPAPACPPALVEQLLATVLRPAVAGCAADGHPFRGVLYAGMMLTADGPKVLEFNARFGDPEAQALLPLLDGDLVEIALACVDGTLDTVPVRWRDATACTVVLAAPGYPAAPVTGGAVTGLDVPCPDGVHVFRAGVTDGPDGPAGAVATGGRVLAVTGVGVDLAAARTAAYAHLARIGLDGGQVRRDIGWRALARVPGGYAATGVDIDAGTDAVERMRAAVESTHGPAVLRGVGAFGGAIDASALAEMQHPVLVASTDGVGTKTMVAAALGRWDTIGADLVNHCIDDVLVQRARPLFFLDYVAAARLDPAVVADVVGGMARACRDAGVALVGGETAEMPGVYHDGHLDVAGTLVGVAERDRLLPAGVAPGDLLVGLASSGPHTNGYSLLRKVFSGIPWDVAPAGLDVTIGDALLSVHRNYLPVLDAALGTDVVRALVHITGGGLPDNLPRALPEGCGAVVRLGSWPVPPLFRLVRALAGVGPDELHRTLNMGIGMVAVVAPHDLAAFQALVAEETWVIGEVVAGPHEVRLV